MVQVLAYVGGSSKNPVFALTSSGPLGGNDTNPSDPVTPDPEPDPGPNPAAP